MVYLDKILHNYVQNDEKASPSIIPTVRGQLVKMIITLEPHGLFLIKYCLLSFIHFNIVWSLVGKMVTRLRRASVQPLVDS